MATTPMSDKVTLHVEAGTPRGTVNACSPLLMVLFVAIASVLLTIGVKVAGHWATTTTGLLTLGALASVLSGVVVYFCRGITR